MNIKFAKRKRMVVCVGVVGLVSAMGYCTREMLCIRTGFGVSVEEANRHLHHGHLSDLPPSATDISYRSGVRDTLVDFAIKEADFKLWCHARGWKPTPVDERNPTVFIFADARKEGIPVQGGWKFNERTTDAPCGVSGVFDRDQGRACVMFCCL